MLACFMVSLECPASLLVLRVTAFGHWAKVSLHWISLLWWLWVQSYMVLSSLGGLPTPWGQEGTWHTPCWGFYYLFLTRLTTARFCSHPKFRSKRLWPGWVLLPEFSSLLWECSPVFCHCGHEWLFCIRLLGGCYCVLTPGWVCFVWPHVHLIDSISIIL